MKIRLIMLLLLSSQMHAFKLNRVILATDANPDYIEFWPVVAKAWKEIIGIQPTLALIANDDVQVDESLGDVIRFQPIEGIPTSFQAQVIRLFLPALYPDDMCILSDIDMIPLNKSYYHDSVAHCSEDSFVIYRDKAYREDDLAYPMCYLAARGATFGEIFDIQTSEDIANQIKAFHAYGLGWCTDELLLHKYLHNWSDFEKRCIKLGHYVQNRLDRVDWKIRRDLLLSGYYIDAHCPRPYSAHKDSIDKLLCAWNKSLSKVRLFPYNPDLIRLQAPLGDLVVTGEINIIRSLINEGDIVFDVGANIGEWTEGVLEHVQPKHIFAFEPVPSIADIFREKIVDDRVSLHECAVSQQRGSAYFFYYPYVEGCWEDGTLSSLYKRARVEDMFNVSGQEVTVNTVRLDDFCAEKGVDRINFLKIDTEGAEWDVLSGAEKLLREGNIDFIQFEYGQTYTDSSRTLKEIYHYLQNFGYAIFKIHFEGLAYVREWSDAFEDYYQSNFLAISPRITQDSYEFKALNAFVCPLQKESVGTHMALLLTAVAHTRGPILEMGAGDFSTPLLHAVCSNEKRLLLTVDTSLKTLHDFIDLKNSWHYFGYVPVYEDDWEANPNPELWNLVGNDADWAVVFINHRPGTRRVQDIERLRSHAAIFVVHDTQEAGYGYAPVLDTFKYKYVDTRYATQTTIVSDSIDVSKFFVQE